MYSNRAVEQLLKELTELATYSNEPYSQIDFIIKFTS